MIVIGTTTSGGTLVELTVKEKDALDRLRHFGQDCGDVEPLLKALYFLQHQRLVEVLREAADSIEGALKKETVDVEPQADVQPQDAYRVQEDRDHPKSDDPGAQPDR